MYSIHSAVLVAVATGLMTVLVAGSVSALTPLPTPPPKPGSYGLEATKPKPPPTTGATITTPSSGASFSESPIRVTGICPDDLLVQLLNNGVLVGAVMCNNGSYSLEVSLFAGTNELVAMVYDDLDQPGPPSNTVTVTYTDTNFTAFGAIITLTSSYGRRAAPAGTSLTWPLQLSGGTGPYAFSIDWGDGSKAELKSQALPGVVDIAHTYKSAGIYSVNIRVTDANGASAFLQLVAVASGKVDASTAAAGDKDKKEGQTAVKPEILWIPTLVSLALLAPAFMLGRMSQVVSLRNKMLKERDAFKPE
jgi:PKD repeat protein